jgi:hypothetical protein
MIGRLGEWEAAYRNINLKVLISSPKHSIAILSVLEIPETKFSHRDESKVGLRLKSGANKHS